MCIAHYTRYEQCKHIEFLQVDGCSTALEFPEPRINKDNQKATYKHKHKHKRRWGIFSTRKKSSRKERLAKNIDQRRHSVSLPLTKVDSTQPKSPFKGPRSPVLLFASRFDSKKLDSDVRFKHLWDFLGQRPRRKTAPRDLSFPGCRQRLRHLVTSQMLGWCGPCNWDAYQLTLQRASGSGLVSMEAVSRRRHLSAPSFMSQRLGPIPETHSLSSGTIPSTPSSSTEKKPQLPAILHKPVDSASRESNHRKVDIFGFPLPNALLITPPTTATTEEASEPRSSCTSSSSQQTPTVHHPESRQETETTAPEGSVKPRRRFSLKKKREKCDIFGNPWSAKLPVTSLDETSRSQARDSTEPKTNPPLTPEKKYTVLSPYANQWPTTPRAVPETPQMNLDSVVMESMAEAPGPRDVLGIPWSAYLRSSSIRSPSRNSNRNAVVYDGIIAPDPSSSSSGPDRIPTPEPLRTPSWGREVALTKALPIPPRPDRARTSRVSSWTSESVRTWSFPSVRPDSVHDKSADRGGRERRDELSDIIDVYLNDLHSTDTQCEEPTSWI